MKSDFEILGLEVNATLDQVKKKYYELMKKFPPESCGEEFITINRSYENIKNNIMENENSLLKDVVNIVFERGNNQREFYNYINEFMKSINEKNFKIKNDKIVELAVCLKKNGYLAEALFLVFCAKQKFENLSLYRLADTYIRFEEFIVSGKTSNKIL